MAGVKDLTELHFICVRSYNFNVDRPKLHIHLELLDLQSEYSKPFSLVNFELILHLGVDHNREFGVLVGNHDGSFGLSICLHSDEIDCVILVDFIDLEVISIGPLIFNVGKIVCHKAFFIGVRLSTDR